MFDKKITQELVKIVYDYTNRGIYLDNNAIVRIIGLFNDAFRLDNYIKDLEYTDNKFRGVINSYEIDSRKILFNYSKSLDSSINSVLRDKKCDSCYDNVLEINLSMLSKIVHEICYAFYFKGCFEGTKYLEQVLYRASFEEKILQLMPISKDEKCKAYTFVSTFLYNNDISFYSTIPSNRMANVTAASYRSLVAKDLKASRIVRNYENSKLLRTQLRDYDFESEINSPTMLYFLNKAMLMEGINFETPVYDINTVQSALEDKSERLPLEDKLYYGLELTKKEQQKLIKKLR